MAPLTDRCLEILDKILAEKRRSKVAGLEIFTREDGRKISRDMIIRAVKRAWKKAKTKKFVFHNYRNTALTDWVNRGINLDAAM
jgi:integrase